MRLQKRTFLIFSLFFILTFIFTSAQQIELKINNNVYGNNDNSSISITPDDKILFSIDSQDKFIADLNIGLFLNGKEIFFELISETVAHVEIEDLQKGEHIFKIVFNNSNPPKQEIYRFEVNNKPVETKPAVTEEKPVVKQNTQNQEQSSDSSDGMFSPLVIILAGLCIVMLIIILVLLKGKNKIQSNSQDEIDQYYKQVGDLKSAFESCKKNTERLDNKNKRLISEINSLEKNINELEEINITLVQQKENLLAKKTQLEELQKQKDEPLAMAVHDKKNPASVIQSLIQLMEGYDLTATEQSEIMQTLVESTENIIKLSREMTEVIARQKEDSILDIEETSIKEIIDSVCSVNSAYAKKKNIKLLNHSSDSLPKIKLDTQKIKEVVDNLVNNAIKYGPERTIVEVKAYFSETKITVEVSDTGVGLSEHDLKIMFSKGMTLSTKPTGGEHSSGLGLWLSKKIVEEHGGKIWAKSKKGVGTKFYFELPIV